MNPIITSSFIDTTKLSNVAQNRVLRISGDAGAKYMVIVASDAGSTAIDTFYNFKAKTFNADFKPSNVLRGTIGANFSSVRIHFPASNTQIYTVQVLADPSSDTTLSTGGAFLSTISQVNNSVVTFALSSRSNADSYKSFPTSLTLTGNATGGSATKTIEYLVENAETDANGFGLFVANRVGLGIGDKALFFTNQTTTTKAVTAGSTIEVASVENLSTSTLITAISSGTLVGTPKIVSINTSAKEITLESNQTFGSGITLTFVATGVKPISLATGMNMSQSLFVRDVTAVTTTIRAGGSGQTVNVNGTYGISGGSKLDMSGLNVNNTGGNDINVVTASETAGSFTMDNAQALVVKDVMKFKSKDSNSTHCSSLDLSGSVSVLNFPSTDLTINIDLDQFVTPGVSGS
tara:strand:+ start:1047 stop:2264 length:1218 start_codon:yes stop_codon:yes gene_type:complete